MLKSRGLLHFKLQTYTYVKYENSFETQQSSIEKKLQMHIDKSAKVTSGTIFLYSSI